MFQLSLPGLNEIPDPLTDSTINTGRGIIEEVAGGQITLGTLVSAILTYVFPIAGIILFFVLLFGGFTLLTSAGNPDQVKKGQQIVVSGLIGFVIIFVSFWVWQLLKIALGIDPLAA
jgi:hypothetical protein